MSVELLPSPPHITGPTWQRTVDGGWHLPERSLGWEIFNWWAKYVRTPGGRNAGSPFLPTDEQARFTLWWYAVDDEGNYVYREGCLRRMKGWGKDPLAAALSLAELCGPVAFSHFDGNGQPVGKPRFAAWVQIAAVSQDQTKNTFRLFPTMVSEALRTEFGLDINKFVIYARDGGLLEAVTSSPASMEGNRPTFVIRNETQWWGCGPDGAINEGHAMAEVITGNLGKTEGARQLSICNAHIPGHGTDTEVTEAEKDYDTWQDIAAGESVDTGVLYDALEAPADTPLSEIPPEREDPEGYADGIERLKAGLRVAIGDAYWLSIDWILGTVLSAKNRVSESRRKFLNQVNAYEDSWLAPWQWDRAIKLGAKLEPGERITLGFDGSKSTDWTALVACRVSDGCLFPLAVWNPEKCPGGEIPRQDVDAVVRSCFETYNTVAFRADVKEFEAYVDAWGALYRRKVKVNASPNNPVAFDMRGQRKRFALDCERFEAAVNDGEICHDGNRVLRQHVLNARRHPTPYDAITIRKISKDSKRKIDMAVCGVLAYGARQDYLMSKHNRPTGGTVIIR